MSIRKGIWTAVVALWLSTAGANAQEVSPPSSLDSPVFNELKGLSESTGSSIADICDNGYIASNGETEFYHCPETCDSYREIIRRLTS